MPEVPSRGDSLLEAYAKWRALQANPPGYNSGEREFSRRLAKCAAQQTEEQIRRLLHTPGAMEARAWKKAAKAMRKTAGGAPAVRAAGWNAYYAAGGRLTRTGFERKLK